MDLKNKSLLFANSKDIKNNKLIVPDGIETIEHFCIDEYAINQLKEVVLPKSVKTIENFAFSNCHALEKINLDNVVDIKFGAFDLTRLKEVNLSSIKYIHSETFKNMLSKMEKIYFSTSLDKIQLYFYQSIENPSFTKNLILELVANIKNIYCEYSKGSYEILQQLSLNNHKIHLINFEGEIQTYFDILRKVNLFIRELNQPNTVISTNIKVQLEEIIDEFETYQIYDYNGLLGNLVKKSINIVNNKSIEFRVGEINEEGYKKVKRK